MQDVHLTRPIGSAVQDRYRIEELLGKGGFGAVYLVRDLRVKGNLFALKEVVDPSRREREHFIFEGQVLQRLDHPSLPRVYRTFNDDAHYRASILMDYIEGTNLEVLRRQQPEGRFPLERVLQLMAPIVDAIGYLHSQQPPIVHRDIKPANIIVSTSSNETSLVDFGIAKEYDTEATTTAVRRCSPGYGAPEQYASGTNLATDIYGLAATFYVLLTGVIPADALQRMTQLGSRHVDPLEPVNALVPTLPKTVADAIQRAMLIKSEDRFSSVKEFWQAVQAPEIQTEDVTPPASSPARRTAKVTPVESVTTTPVSVVVRPLTPAQRSLSAQATGKRRSLWFLVLPFLILLTLLSGVLWVTGLVHFPAIFSNSSATKLSPTVRQSSATRAVTTPTVTATPTAENTTTATPTETPQSSSPSAPAPGSYPLLSSTYNGSLVNKYTRPPTNGTMVLSRIQQNNGAINGKFAVGPGLVASDTFIGSVTTDSKISFTVPSYAGLAPLFFTGQVQGNGTMSGTYCSLGRDGQCNTDIGGWGDWTASP